MAEILVRTDTREVLLFSEGRLGRAALAGANETLVEVADLPAGIAKFVTRYTAAGALEQITPPSVNTGVEVLAAAQAHAQRLVLKLNPVWLRDVDGTQRALRAGGADTAVRMRWRAAYLWVLSPLAVVRAITASTDSQWGDAEAQAALTAYQSLVPDDAANIDSWFYASAPSVWRGYRRAAVPGDTGLSYAHFGWTRGADTPSFLTDVDSAARWDGTGNTLLATLPKAATTAAQVLA